MDIEEKRRTVRALLGTVGRGFAQECGFDVTNNPASLFQLMYLSVLLARTGDYRRAVRTARALRDRGWDNAARMARSGERERAEVLRGCGYRDADPLAATLGDLARAVVERYGGDLRRLRTAARRNPDRERELLTELPGVDGRVLELFLRDVQVPWREVWPFADRRALAAARRLGLARGTDDLAPLAGSPRSERLPWLVGALARVDLDKRYDEITAAAKR
jgi:endonuclease III